MCKHTNGRGPIAGVGTRCCGATVNSLGATEHEQSRTTGNVGYLCAEDNAGSRVVWNRFRISANGGLIMGIQ